MNNKLTEAREAAERVDAAMLSARTAMRRALEAANAAAEKAYKTGDTGLQANASTARATIYMAKNSVDDVTEFTRAMAEGARAVEAIWTAEELEQEERGQ